MNRLVDAKRAFEVQYETAKQFKFERAVRRSVGNLGMINYHLSQQDHDDALLKLAVDRLMERVQSARYLREAIDAQDETQTRNPIGKKILKRGRPSGCLVSRVATPLRGT